MKVKNFAMQKGAYDVGDGTYTYTLGTDYSSDYTTRFSRRVLYDIDDSEILLILHIDSSSLDALVAITIDEVDGVYSWAYVDTNDCYMFGTVYAATFGGNTTLGYSSHNLTTTSLRNTVQELSSSMVRNILLNFDDDYASIGVEAEDFGFYNY